MASTTPQPREPGDQSSGRTYAAELEQLLLAFAGRVEHSQDATAREAALQLKNGLQGLRHKRKLAQAQARARGGIR